MRAPEGACTVGKVREIFRCTAASERLTLLKDDKKGQTTRDHLRFN